MDSSPGVFPTLSILSALILGLAQGNSAELFDMVAVRDSSTLEATVVQDWRASKKDPAIRQKLLEITVCEWWPGQKIRLPVTLNVPAGDTPCRNVVVANQPLANRVSTPTGGQLTLLKEHGVGVVLIGMGTIDAMEPAGELHHGMRKQLLRTKDPRFTPAWIWGMSQMRALTAAMTEPDVFQPEKVLVTGGSKRGIASAVAGIHDDRFTAILPVVAPPLGNPGAGHYLIGAEAPELEEIDRKFYADLAAGKLGLEPGVAAALRDRTKRRANQRVTLAQARAAGWSGEDIAGITDRVWSASRVTDHLPALKKRGLEIFYNVGTNDSVTPALLELGEKLPGFPVCIIPGGQHGGPSTAGYTRRVTIQSEVKDNFVSFARHHFFGDRKFVAAPRIESDWAPDSRTLSVRVTFPDETEPQANTLWWNLDRSRPYTLPFEYDAWEYATMKKTGPGEFEVSVQLDESPARLDFLSLHTHTENGLSLTVSSPYRRVVPKK